MTDQSTESGDEGLGTKRPTMTEYETLLVEYSDLGVVRVTLNRPKQLNAVNQQMWSDLGHIFDALRQNEKVRVVVVAAAGSGFCSGADFSEPARPDRPHSLMSMRRIADVALSLQSLPQPTIAEVNGAAVGVGCNLALSCDLVVASDQARFSEIFARRGFSLDFGGSWILPRLIGLHKAKELAFFADVIDADEAERFGIVNRVVPAAELRSFVDEWSRRLCALAPIALAQTKSLLNRSISPSLGELLEAEGTAQSVNLATSDVKEGLEAWAQKRPPEFRGR